MGSWDSIIADSTLRGLLFTIARNNLISAYRRNVNAPVYEIIWTIAIQSGERILRR